MRLYESQKRCPNYKVRLVPALLNAFPYYTYPYIILVANFIDLVHICLDRLFRLFQFNHLIRNRINMRDQGKAAPNPIVN